jgi:hypothetical protein
MIRFGGSWLIGADPLTGTLNPRRLDSGGGRH